MAAANLAARALKNTVGLAVLVKQPVKLESSQRPRNEWYRAVGQSWS